MFSEPDGSPVTGGVFKLPVLMLRTLNATPGAYDGFVPPFTTDDAMHAIEESKSGPSRRLYLDLSVV